LVACEVLGTIRPHFRGSLCVDDFRFLSASSLKDLPHDQRGVPWTRCAIGYFCSLRRLGTIRPHFRGSLSVGDSRFLSASPLKDFPHAQRGVPWTRCAESHGGGFTGWLLGKDQDDLAISGTPCLVQGDHIPYLESGVLCFCLSVAWTLSDLEPML